MTAVEFAALAASYFLGAIPTSYLAGRVFKGIDLRQHGFAAPAIIPCHCLEHIAR